VQEQCPVRAAHRRLMDCHVLWHHLESSYHDPDGFRLNLNSLIQNLRNVTWLLQKAKKGLPNFDQWYGEWQVKATSDVVAAWTVAARNRIVKEADLEVHSYARVTVRWDWLGRASASFVTPPRMTMRHIINRVMRDAPPIPKGVITVERRWVDVALPKYELLDATARQYGLLVDVLRSAHNAAGGDCTLLPRTPPCVTNELVRPSCMSRMAPERRTHVYLPERTLAIEGHVSTDLSPEAKEESYRIYGKPPTFLVGDIMEFARSLFEHAKGVLQAGGFHISLAYLMKDGIPVRLTTPHIEGQRDKFLMMERIAYDVARLDADGLVTVNESWFAELPEGEEIGIDTVPARYREDRSEALTVMAVTKEGKFAHYLALFHRDADGNVVFDRDMLPPENEGTVVNIIEPIARVWGWPDVRGPSEQANSPSRDA
jgi:hypothetical protein